MQELHDSIRKLEAVAGMLLSIAYKGYESGGSAVVPAGGQKHGMVEGGIEIANPWAHEELQRLKREANTQARAIDVITGRYHRKAWDRSPAEPVTEEQLQNLEEYERRRRGVRKS